VLQQQAAALQAQVVQLQGATLSSKLLQADIDALTSRNHMLKTDMASLELMNNRYKHELDAAIRAVKEARVLEATLGDCNKVLLEREAALAQAHTHIASLQSAGSAGDASAAEQVQRLQQQVEELRAHWKQTHERERCEYDHQLVRKEQRNQELEMEMDSLKARNAAMSPPVTQQASPRGGGRVVVPQLAVQRAQAQRAAAPEGLLSPGSSSMLSPGGTVRGVIGMKISNTPPHHVLSVTELMDETGAIVNGAVGLGDELTGIDKVPVHSMPVGDVVRHVAGLAGTLVQLAFRNPRTDETYAVTAQRHLALTRNSATPAQRGSSAPPPAPDRPTGALEASAPGPIQQVTLSKSRLNT